MRPGMEKSPTTKGYQREIIWKNVILLAYVHLAAIRAMTLMPSFHVFTHVWLYFVGLMGGLGITAGAHRLWTHKSYKAKPPLKIFLALCNSIAVQNSIFDWSRDHRCHHKYSDTDADPHNSTRGFFFSHCGWLLVRKHPQVIEKGKGIDLNDLLNDPVVMIQKKHYVASAVLLGFVLPSVVPVWFWNETIMNAYLSSMYRYCITLNLTWCVNSVAHIWGTKPYDKLIKPSDNIFVEICAIGEGYHNFHHVFPFDYSTSEFGLKRNFTTFFIDLMAYFGLAYDRRSTPTEVVQARIVRTG